MSAARRTRTSEGRAVEVVAAVRRRPHVGGHFGRRAAARRNKDFQEVTLEKDGQTLLRFALAYGFRNIQNLVQKLKRGKSAYHYVEVMACPSAAPFCPGGSRFSGPTLSGSKGGRSSPFPAAEGKAPILCPKWTGPGSNSPPE
ncbi:cytosolic iron-sulfur assembly component 3-like isoform X2 [Paroedura picta]|uniref:cytosolic iron-sulfur assembly component 3-like isoform X2 n=1 Tax=Paroedura picta TaxID=143630 RepID=UPI0040567995